MSQEWPKQENESKEVMHSLEKNMVDKELSPEAIEKIMGKVQDINEIGTAYTHINYGTSPEGANNFYIEQRKLERILKMGLLGSRSKENIASLGWDENTIKEEWKKQVRGDKLGKIFFNIVGVAEHHNQFTPAEERTNIKNSYYAGNGAVFLIFDTSYYKPEHASFYIDSKNYPELLGCKNRTYRYAPSDRFQVHSYKEYLPDEKTAENYYNKNKDKFKSIEPYDKTKYHLYLPPASTEYGFLISYRVPPRFLKGLVIDIRRKLTPQEIEETINKEYKLESKERKEFLKKDLEEWGENRYDKAIITNHKLFIEKTLGLIDVMKKASKDKPDSMIPIYDIEGNLHWPKQMSYEEIKKFTTGRDTKKEK